MTDSPKHSVSVAGVVVDDQDQVLVIKRRDNGHWEPPGGVLELDETFEEGVKREVLEETGVYVEVERLTGIYKNMEQAIVALVFRCSALSHSLKETVESAEIDWVPLDKVSRLCKPAYAVRFEDAFRSGCGVRVHDGVRLEIRDR